MSQPHDPTHPSNNDPYAPGGQGDQPQNRFSTPWEKPPAPAAGDDAVPLRHPVDEEHEPQVGGDGPAYEPQPDDTVTFPRVESRPPAPTEPQYRNSAAPSQPDMGDTVLMPPVPPRSGNQAYPPQQNQAYPPQQNQAYPPQQNQGQTARPGQDPYPQQTQMPYGTVPQRPPSPYGQQANSGRDPYGPVGQPASDVSAPPQHSATNAAADRTGGAPRAPHENAGDTVFAPPAQQHRPPQPPADQGDTVFVPPTPRNANRDHHDTVIAPPAGRPAEDTSDTVLSPRENHDSEPDTSETVIAPSHQAPASVTGPVGDGFAPQPEHHEVALAAHEPGATATTPRRRFPWWLAALAGLLVLALLGWLLVHFLHKPAPAPASSSPTSSATTATSSPTPTTLPALAPVLPKDPKDIKIMDKFDPWFVNKVESSAVPSNVRRGQYETTQGNGKTLYTDVYEGKDLTVDIRSGDLKPASIHDGTNYRCGRLIVNDTPTCFAALNNGFMEVHANKPDVSDATVEQAFKDWIKGNQ